MVPSEVLRPSPTPLRSARGEVQGATWEANAIGAGPARSPRPRLRRPLDPALTSGSRSPRRPEAEPQPREPPARPSSASSCGGRSPHAACPAREYGFSSAPREPGRGTASQGPKQVGPGGLRRVTAPRPLPTAAGQGAPSRRALGTQRMRASPLPPTAGRPLPPRSLPELPAVPAAPLARGAAAAAGFRTRERRKEPATLMRPPQRPPLLLPSERQPMSRAGAGRRRRRRRAAGGRRGAGLAAGRGWRQGGAGEPRGGCARPQVPPRPREKDRRWACGSHARSKM